MGRAVRGAHFLDAQSANGRVALAWETDASEAVSRAWRGRRFGGQTAPAATVGSLSANCRRGAMGFGWDAYDRVHLFTVSNGSAVTRQRVVVAPHWFVALVLAVLPGVRLLPRRRRPAGLCRACGYDLRASPDRCPECGAAGTDSP